MNFFVFPLVSIGLIVAVHFNSLLMRSIFISFIGLANVKNMNCQCNCQEQLRRKDLPYIYAVFAFLDTMSTAYFCLYLLYVSRDAVTLMIIVNYINFIAFIVHIFIATESPKWLLLNGRE